MASSGEYYCLGVVRRDHPCFRKPPDSFTIDRLIDSHEQDTLDVEDDLDDLDLASQLIMGTTPKEREQHRLLVQKQAEKVETERQTRTRSERAESQRGSSV